MLDVNNIQAAARSANKLINEGRAEGQPAHGYILVVIDSDTDEMHLMSNAPNEHREYAAGVLMKAAEVMATTPPDRVFSSKDN